VQVRQAIVPDTHKPATTGLGTRNVQIILLGAEKVVLKNIQKL